MLVRALLQTSLVLWLTQQTLQGGVKPQSVSWGRVMPARGVGMGPKPGGVGALGAVGNRYGSKAMKNGMGRYPGAQLGLGAYRNLGLGGKTGPKQGGYAAQGPYGANLGTGMGLGTGLTNGLGLGHAGKRMYGGGMGTLPGYGALGAGSYPAARQGVSAADTDGLEMALGQAVQDLKSAKSRIFGPLLGGERSLGAEMPNLRSPTAAEVPAGTGFRPDLLPSGKFVKPMDPNMKSSSLGPLAFNQPGQGGEPILNRKVSGSHGASLGALGIRPPFDNTRNLGAPPTQSQNVRDYGPSFQRGQKNCGPTRDLSLGLDMNYPELLGAEAHRPQTLMPHVGKDGKHFGRQGEEIPQSPDADVLSLLQGQQRPRPHLSPVEEKQRRKSLGLADKIPAGIKGHGLGPANPHLQEVHRNVPMIPGAGLDMATAGARDIKSLNAQAKEPKSLSPAALAVKESKSLSAAEQTGGNTQATRYGGAGNYLGGNLGAGGYGAGPGQGAYLGGAAGKLAAGAAAALGQGYGDGVTGYMGPMGGNGYAGHGNGYGDGYGAGLGYPAELTDGAENKAGKSQALNTGAYAGQVQGAYGALGAGLDATGGKYGGAAQVPYGGAPVIPTGLEGDGGYPYGAQQLNLGGDGTKTASKHGYGPQLGVPQDALGDPAGKYGMGNGALGNGYKG